MGKTSKSSASGKKKVKPAKDQNGQGLLEKNFSLFEVLKLLSFIIFVVVCGLLNSYHEHTMFENDRHFSHLSSLEREMTFRTEMGLYFSFYKSVVEAPTFLHGLNQLLNCNLTEYPNTINAIRKYNVFPEIILGSSFRVMKTITKFLKIKTKECWVVDRGEGFDEVESCEGIGDMYYFYVKAVFTWNSLVACLIFLYGYFISDSFLGGLISICSFYYNHGESTRVQWTPPLRESFGYPFCLSGMLFVSLSFKYPNNSKYWRIMIALSSVGFLTTWQFAQFPLLVQAMAAFGLYFLGFIDISHLQGILEGQILGLIGGFILLFANPLLFSSFYTPFLLIAYMLCKIKNVNLNNQKAIKLVQMVCLIVGTMLLKVAISTAFSIKDDNHIWNLLRSKFTNYKDFHTMLYTCAVEFDFLDKETPMNLTKTLLIPLALLIVCFTFFKVCYIIWTKQSDLTDYAEIIFIILQTSAFTVMAILFMRLKLLLTPNLCVFVSLLASKKLFSFISNSYFRSAVVFLVISLMSVNGITNLQNQRQIMGEYSNPGLEELLKWVNVSTPTDAVFSGPMPTMANLMLSTRRPIVNNPFYEDSSMREKTLLVYSLYSRKDVLDVHKTLKSLGVNYAVIVRPYCYGKNKLGCAMIDLWDVEDPQNSQKTQLCQRMMADPEPFIFVFRNDEYAVVKI